MALKQVYEKIKLQDFLVISSFNDSSQTVNTSTLCEKLLGRWEKIKNIETIKIFNLISKLQKKLTNNFVSK